MNAKVVLSLLLVFLVLGGVIVYVRQLDKLPTEIVACTEEAKLCADGSYVGRTGPKCEFTECPIVQREATTSSTTALNQKIFNNRIFITPLKVISDSRCPEDVTCISAGEISVKTMLEEGTTTKNVVLTLQSPVVFEGNNVTLTKVIPENNSKKPLIEKNYRFTFLVTPLAQSATGTISGRVTTSPTCAVERIPNEPQCSPKPYATVIQVREEGKPAILKTIQSDNAGAFTVDLLAGTYELEAKTKGNTSLPKCVKETVRVTAGAQIVTDISCDTGIR